MRKYYTHKKREEIEKKIPGNQPKNKVVMVQPGESVIASETELASAAESWCARPRADSDTWRQSMRFQLGYF